MKFIKNLSNSRVKKKKKSLVLCGSKKLPLFNFSLPFLSQAQKQKKSISKYNKKCSISKYKPRVNVMLGYLNGWDTKMGHNVPESLLFDCNELKH